MRLPTINLIPSRAAVSSDSPTTLDVLVRIIPPTAEVELKRPTLNIGFVIDRSGSMGGQKIEYARQAACYAVQQLLPTDRVSVTIYDDQIETLVPSTLAVDKAGIIRKIQGIHSRNMTALHAGWAQGGSMVAQHLNPEHLNRVILLSDGLANVGETNPDAIATDVHKLAKRGISTTTMGVGNDYKELVLRTSNSPQMQQEAADLAQLEAELDSRQYTKFSKTSTSQSYYRHRSSTERYRQRQPQSIQNRIEIIQGDITQQKVDAIVNPTDESFSGNGSVDAAIHAIAGTELKEACRQLNGISTGEAKITKGYNLPARFVIHTVGPVWQGGNHGEGEMLARCYRNSLALAEQYSLRTVAFPSISTGAFGFPIELASQIAVREVSSFMMSNSSVEKVIFVCLGQSACQYYLDAIRRI